MCVWDIDSTTKTVHQVASGQDAGSEVWYKSRWNLKIESRSDVLI